MNVIYYIGLDIHKKTIAYCIKKIDGTIVRQGTVAAERKALSKWMSELPGLWHGAMEATIFTGWVYDFLRPHAVELKVAHPAMLKAITAAKKKNDRADAEKIADLLRVNLLPECHMMPEELRELRRIPGVGEIMALTWVLEIGEVSRFSSSRQAISYCGLCSGQHESAGKDLRGPISKKRNKHLQNKLIEAAKLAPHWNEQLAVLHEKELACGNRNRATLSVARKLVEYMLAVDRRETGFELLKEAA